MVQKKTLTLTQNLDSNEDGVLQNMHFIVSNKSVQEGLGKTLSWKRKW